MKKIFLVFAALVFIAAGCDQSTSAVQEPQTQQSASPQATQNTQEPVDCKALGLPEGSYTVTDNTCQYTEEHATQVTNIASREYKAGDEVHLAYIKNIYEKSGKVYIDADYFERLSQVNGSCASSGKTTSAAPPCNPNGFLDSNENTQIRTFVLASGVKIRLLEEYNTIPDLRTLTPQQFLTGKNKFNQKFTVYYDGAGSKPNYVPFELIIKGGQIIYIHQLYTP